MTRAPPGRLTGVHETPPSGVMYAELPPVFGLLTNAMPTVGLRKWMSVPTRPPPPLEAAVPGIPVLRAKVSPPSVVISTEPFLSSRKPVCGETKLNAATGSGQPDSATLKIRLKTWPPSSEMRVTQPPPPPTITVVGLSAWTRSRLTVVPVVRPVHDWPALAVESAVPPKPTA